MILQTIVGGLYKRNDVRDREVKERVRDYVFQSLRWQQ